MSELTIALWTGLVAGAVHVYAGADHLAALLPLSIDRKSKAAKQGARWGLGHSVGVIIVASILLLSREALDISPIERWGERIVGLALISLGLWGIRAAFRHHIHIHQHKHDGETHAHLHAHLNKGHHPKKTKPNGLHSHRHTAVAMGALHGVAGMAHLLGVLPSLAFVSVASSLLYLLSFALGSTLSMALFTTSVSAITQRWSHRVPGFCDASRYVASGICVIVGIVWVAMPLIG